MAIVVVGRWTGNLEQGLPHVREVGESLKARGATSVRIGNCYSGQYAVQIFSAVAFPDWESFGKAHQALATDRTMRRSYAEATKHLKVEERSVLVVEEL